MSNAAYKPSVDPERPHLALREAPLRDRAGKVDIASPTRARSLQAEQNALLEMIARGAPASDCLLALTAAVSRVHPGIRAAVLTVNAERTAVSEIFAANLEPAFGGAIEGLPVGETPIGTCSAAILQGRPVHCADIARDEHFSPEWREHCLSHGVRACSSMPVFGPGGKAVASFVLLFGEAHEPDEWELQIAAFGSHIAGIVLERDRAAGELRVKEERLRHELYAQTRLQQLSGRLIQQGDLKTLLQEILAAAADLTGTDKGNIQIYDEHKGTLRIAVHQGHGRRLVEHFAECGWEAACGKSVRTIQRAIVEDVLELESLRGTPGFEIIVEDGIRAIQSTPLVSRDGRLLGVLNNHYSAPGRPDDQKLRHIDLLARQAADLIERARTEEALRTSEERFRKTIDSLPAAIYTTDAHGRLTHFNPACIDFSGRTPELGSDSWCITWKLHYPDGRPMPHDECPMAIALKEGRVIEGAEAIAERPDGTRIWFMPHPTPLRDGAGNLIGGVNMLVDITHRKQAEQISAKLAAIVESSDDAIISKDLRGVIMTWNAGAQRIFGYTAEETVGQPVTMLMPPERVDEEPRILERLCRGERIEHYETVRRRKDGSLVDVSLTVSPIVDGRGRVVGASKIARNITERKRYQETLERALAERTEQVTRQQQTLAAAERMAAVGTLASGLAHDMNNVLLPLSTRLGRSSRTPASTARRTTT